ncbi:hypothetical protein [Candidatus Poriferisodalis sp.]|uniref:hypothetical protein n=1 Tax=Candidatus Poriferisodalis sp. TaxID=3101277 RepID=UPI003B013D8F
MTPQESRGGNKQVLKLETGHSAREEHVAPLAKVVAPKDVLHGRQYDSRVSQATPDLVFEWLRDGVTSP